MDNLVGCIGCGSGTDYLILIGVIFGLTFLIIMACLIFKSWRNREWY